MGPKSHSFSFAPLSFVLLMVPCPAVGIGWCTCSTSFIFHERFTCFVCSVVVVQPRLVGLVVGVGSHLPPTILCPIECVCVVHGSDGMKPNMDRPSKHKKKQGDARESILSKPIDPKFLCLFFSIADGFVADLQVRGWARRFTSLGPEWTTPEAKKRR